MKPTLSLGLSQQLTLTPQLRQAIRLLQLSSIELAQEIQEAVETNPVLELDENGQDGAGSDAAADAGEAAGPGEAASTATGNDDGNDDREAASDGGEVLDDGGWDAPDDWETRTVATGSAAGGDDPEFPQDRSDANPERLVDHLRWQLNLTPFSPRDREIAEVLIEAIDDDGYLREPLDATRQALGAEFAAIDDEIETVRHRLQHFDPVGVASRSVEECLRVQIDELPEHGVSPELRELAKRLVEQQLGQLARQSSGQLAYRLGTSAAAVDAALVLIRRLSPKPGLAYSESDDGGIAPDAIAYKQEGRWQVRLAPHAQPRLSISRHYESMLGASRGETATYLRGHLQEARWLIRSLQQRGESLAKVTGEIVRLQSAFLEYGPEAMRPLTLREVADNVGLHESTVSRITTRKYLQTPRGTFELKHFFSAGLASAEGGEASATAVRSMIGKLIEAEDPRKPLSDQAIAKTLNDRGIAVARRTVAKYREAMNIPSSSDRCRLG